MENTVRKPSRRIGRSILSQEQMNLLTENIKKIQLSTNGLTKKKVVDKAFAETFGSNDNWPIQAVSSTVARYWKRAFPKETTKKRRSIQPLLDDLRRTPQDISNPQVPVVPLECVFHDCPWCRKPIRALVVAAATVMKHEQNR